MRCFQVHIQPLQKQIMQGHKVGLNLNKVQRTEIKWDTSTCESKLEKNHLKINRKFPYVWN